MIEDSILRELRYLINKLYNESYDKTALWLKILDILDYYDKHTAINHKNKIKKEYRIGD